MRLGNVKNKYLIITGNCKDDSCHKRQRQELAEHTGMYGRREFSQVAMTMMVYTFAAVVLR